MLYCNQKERNKPIQKEIITMKTITTIIYTISILFCIWFAASWIDIVSDNCNLNPVHSEYNLFVMMTENN